MSPALHPHERGPEGSKIRIEICPARFVGRDVIDLVDSYILTGERLSLEEQERLTPVELEAVWFTRAQLETLRAEIGRRYQKR